MFSPNTTTPPDLGGTACGPSPCLFNVAVDPGEHVDLHASMPDKVSSMMARFKELDSEYHPPKVSPAPLDQRFCQQALEHRGFTAPYQTPV